jgi:hypothetical protein
MFWSPYPLLAYFSQPCEIGIPHLIDEESKAQANAVIFQVMQPENGKGESQALKSKWKYKHVQSQPYIVLHWFLFCLLT